MCDNCNYTVNGIHSNGYTLCDECLNSNEIVIKRKLAVENYRLTTKDLTGIRYIQHPILFGDRFLTKDIDYLSIKKYGSKEAREQAIKNRSIKREERLDRIEKAQPIRRKELDDHLKSIGLSGVIDDLPICIDYIHNKSNYTVEEIGRIMLEQHFYDTYTNYNDILNKINSDDLDVLEAYEYEQNLPQIECNAKRDAMIQYIKDNFNNIHKCMDEVPITLKDEFDVCYKIVKSVNGNNKRTNYGES